MTRSAITLISISDAMGALLVMAHPNRYAKAHFFSGVVLMAGERLRVLGFHVLICPGFKTIAGGARAMVPENGSAMMTSRLQSVCGRESHSQPAERTGAPRCAFDPH
jgi:hypothetical protein